MMPWLAVDTGFDLDRKVIKVDGFARALIQLIWRLVKGKNTDRLSLADWDAEYLARLSGFDGYVDQVAAAMDALLASGLVVFDENAYVIPGWDNWQRRAKGAKRQEDFRKRESESNGERYGSNGEVLSCTVLSKKKEAENLANFMADEMRKEKQDAKVKPGKWVPEIEKMLRIDGRSPDAARRVIAWATHDDFWAPNIRSGRALRNQFDRLELQMASAGKPKFVKQETARPAVRETAHPQPSYEEQPLATQADIDAALAAASPGARALLGNLGKAMSLPGGDDVD